MLTKECNGFNHRVSVAESEKRINWTSYGLKKPHVRFVIFIVKFEIDVMFIVRMKHFFFKCQLRDNLVYYFLLSMLFNTSGKNRYLNKEKEITNNLNYQSRNKRCSFRDSYIFFSSSTKHLTVKCSYFHSNPPLLTVLKEMIPKIGNVILSRDFQAFFNEKMRTTLRKKKRQNKSCQNDLALKIEPWKGV